MRPSFCLPVCYLLAFPVWSAVGAAAWASEESVTVEYRLTQWKTVHIHDQKKIEAYQKTFKKLGVEHKTFAHGDHMDIRYRCSEWRKIKLPSHDDAHRWEEWLKKIGFQTKHDH